MWSVKICDACLFSTTLAISEPKVISDFSYFWKKSEKEKGHSNNRWRSMFVCLFRPRFRDYAGLCLIAWFDFFSLSYSPFPILYDTCSLDDVLGIGCCALMLYVEWQKVSGDWRYSTSKQVPSKQVARYKKTKRTTKRTNHRPQADARRGKGETRQKKTYFTEIRNTTASRQLIEVVSI